MPDIDTSQLEAVNTMLHLIGEAPVNSLTTNVTADVALAIRTLAESNRQTQVRGWHWNTDYKVTITADSNSKFAWETDWIRFDVDRGRYTSINIVRRGQFLWDAKEATDVFSESTLEGHVVRYLAFDDIPEAARNFMMIRAGRIFLARTLGDEFRSGFAVRDEQQAWHVLLEEEDDQADYNYLDTGPPLMVRRRFGAGLNLKT